MHDEEVDFLVRFVMESDAIEGIRNDPDEVRRHIEHGMRRDSVVPMGHVGALLYLRSSTVPVGEALVKTVQRLIVDGQHLKGERKLRPEEKGEWRTHDIGIRTSDDITRPVRRIGSRRQDVPQDMAVWIARAHLLDADPCISTPRDRVREIAALHWLYERIHPFSDGNGRSGRALAYYQYLRAGLPKFVFTSHDRGASYYPCFQRSTPELMERYFLERTAVR